MGSATGDTVLKAFDITSLHRNKILLHSPNEDKEKEVMKGEWSFFIFLSIAVSFLKSPQYFYQNIVF